MKVFSKNLERMISLNRLESAVDSLLNTISDFEPDTDAGRMEGRQLRNQVITLSQRLYQATDNHKKGISTEEDLSRERLSISTSMLDIVQDMHRYPHFAEYIREVEDEEAWRVASRKNTIEAYEEYFDNFPNGKYKEQTHKLIVELREVERRRAEEIKRMAEEEKRRRSQKHEESRREVFATPPPEPQPKKQDSIPPPPPPPEPDFQGQQKPRGTYSRQSFSSGEGGNQTIPVAGERWDTTYLIIAYVGALFIGLIGIIAGIYLLTAKKDGQSRYDKWTRNQGIYLIIFGIISWIVGMEYMYGL